jgi:hypothetical protein
LIELVGSLWGNGSYWLPASLRAETSKKLKRECKCKSAPRTLYIGFRKAKLKNS